MFLSLYLRSIIIRTDKTFMFVVIITCCCSDMPIAAKTEVTEIEKSKTGNYPVPSTKRRLAHTLFSLLLSVVKKFFFFSSKSFYKHW